MEKKKGIKNACAHVLPLILVVSLLLSLCACTAALEGSEAEQGYSITEPYEYAVDLDSEEWKSLSLSERVASVYVSDETVEAMTTQALAITVLCNPFLSDFWAFDNYALAMQTVPNKVNGLTELLAREDVLETLALIEADEELLASVLIDYGSDETNMEILSMKLGLLRDLVALIAGEATEWYIVGTSNTYS
ncbi:MAG: hypothetical protein LIO42_00545 [Oscillospiraceae bacterium]|nr:hypothetical protein [Oscillospiraceae bacterium]